MLGLATTFYKINEIGSTLSFILTARVQELGWASCVIKMETINGIELKGMDSSTLKEFILGRRLKFTLVNGSTIIGTVKLCECASNINPAGGGNLTCDIIVDDVKINIMTIKEIKCLQ